MRFRVVLASFLFLSPMVAQAQSTDPVDKNVSGGYVGGQLTLGQAVKVGDTSPGTAYLVGVDVGYVMKRDTWNRIELGLEVATGKAEYRDKQYGAGVDFDLDLKLVTMLKAGYGYSLGDHAFGLFRVGVGIAQADLEGKANGATLDAGSASGTAAMIAYDVVFPASDALDFTVGASYRIMSFNFDDIQGNDGDVQVNLPAIYAGARFRL